MTTRGELVIRRSWAAHHCVYHLCRKRKTIQSIIYQLFTCIWICVENITILSKRLNIEYLWFAYMRLSHTHTQTHTQTHTHTHTHSLTPTHTCARLQNQNPTKTQIGVILKFSWNSEVKHKNPTELDSFVSLFLFHHPYPPFLCLSFSDFPFLNPFVPFKLVVQKNEPNEEKMPWDKHTRL